MCRQRPASCNLHPLKKEQLATAALTSMPFVSICFMGTKRVPRPPVRDELADLVGLQSCHLQLDSCPHSATHVRRKQLTKFTRLETTGVGNIQAGLSVIRQVESTEIYGSAVENSYTYTYIFIFIYIYTYILSRSVQIRSLRLMGRRIVLSQAFCLIICAAEVTMGTMF